MNLAIFDIDGTLTKTDHIDDICFVQAMTEAFAITDVSTDWAGYSHTTDSAITLDIFKKQFNRAPYESELLKLKSHFVHLLEDYRAKDSSLFAEIAGATTMLRRLNQEPEWIVAIASGGWRTSAALKLKVAGIEADDFPAAFADDGLSREKILQTAISKAERLYRQKHFSRIVSVGDGVWDVRTARNLKIPFLGICAGDDAEKKLRRAGATHFIRDFTNYKQLIYYLTKAEIPQEDVA
jgi:phosphoglycolate phosphatase-like HAD superfamily hydrolase